MSSTLNGIIHIFIALLNIGMGLFVYFKNLKNKLNISFCIMALTTAILPFIEGIIFITLDSFWIIGVYFGILECPAFLILSYTIADEKNKNINVITFISYFLTLILIIISINTSLIMKEIISVYPLKVNHGPFEGIFRLYILYFLLHSLYILFKGLKTSSGIKKIQLKYFITGIFIYGLGAAFCIIILPLFQIRNFLTSSSFFSIFWLGMTMYSIIKYKLLEIETVIHKTFLWIIILFAIGLPLYILIIYLSDWLKATTPILLAITILLIIHIFDFYLNKIKPYIDHLFSRKKYKFEDVLINISIKTSTTLNLNILLDRLINEIKQTFYVDNVIIFLNNGNKADLILQKKSEEDKNCLIRYESSLIKIINTNQKALLRDEINFNPTYLIIKNEIITLFDLYDLELIVPIIVGNNITGLICLGKKSNLKNFNSEDILLLELIGEESGIPIYNSIYHKKVLQEEEEALIKIKEASLETIFKLTQASEFKDLDTSMHIKRMSYYSACIAEKLKLDKNDVEAIRYASAMHDVGKIGIPDYILTKPGKLTIEEWEIMKKHTIFGSQILQNSNFEYLKLAEIIALSHHEKWDGTGYPNGIKGKKIPIESRIVAIADVFDALISVRSYKPALPIDKAIEIIKNESGKHFDPEIVIAFLNVLPEIKNIFLTFQENKNQ